MSARVLINRHRQTFILIKQGSKWLQIIGMNAAGLHITRITEDEFAADYIELNYPVERAARKFLAFGQSVGMTDGVRDALTPLCTLQQPSRL